MTRRRLLQELDSREITEWDAFFELEEEQLKQLRDEQLLEREAISDLRR